MHSRLLLLACVLLYTSIVACSARTAPRSTADSSRIDSAFAAQHSLRSTRSAAPAASPSDLLITQRMREWKDAAYTKLEDESLAGFNDGSIAPLPFQPGQNNYSLYHPAGFLRTYFLWVPSSFSPAAPKPISLVVALHGLGDDAVDFATGTNLTNMAEDLGFLLLYPQGSMGDIGTGWNAGTCCVDETVDDLGFISQIVSLVNSTFPVRPESIHSLGFSNGAMMTESLGCNMSDVFRSIASVSGDTLVVWGGSQALAACDAEFQAPTSILHVHGTADFVVPFTGEVFLGWASIPDDMNAWAARNKCPNAPIQTLNVGTFTNQLWQNCSANGLVQVELVINAGGAHTWPQVPGVFDVSQYIIAFWNRVTPGGI